jgi:hypothetical protein
MGMGIDIDTARDAEALEALRDTVPMGGGDLPCRCRLFASSYRSEGRGGPRHPGVDRGD